MGKDKYLLRIAIDGPDGVGKTHTANLAYLETARYCESVKKTKYAFDLHAVRWPSKEFRQTDRWKQVPEKLAKGVTLDDIKSWAYAMLEDNYITLKELLRKSKTNMACVIEDRGVLSTFTYQFAMYCRGKGYKHDPTKNLPPDLVTEYESWCEWVASTYNAGFESLGLQAHMQGSIYVLLDRLEEALTAGDAKRNATETDKAFEEMAPLIWDLFTKQSFRIREYESPDYGGGSHKIWSLDQKIPRLTGFGREVHPVFQGKCIDLYAKKPLGKEEADFNSLRTVSTILDNIVGWDKNFSG